MTEKELARRWRGLRGREVVTSRGNMKVLYPGRANGGGGPDFIGAALLGERGMVRGDVEVHLSSRDWQAHGHHRDPHYDNVVLHVVMVDDAPGHIPSLVLGPPAGEDPLPCPRNAPLPVLMLLGEERFRAKGQRLLGLAEARGPGQALYEGVMEALGYSRNQGPMVELARLLPLAVLEGEGPRALEGRLREGAEKIPGWELSGARPTNHPFVRLRAMAGLLGRYREGGLLEGLRRVVALARGACQVENSLMVPGLGRARAAAIAVNVLLPFFYALGLEGARDLFLAYPLREESDLVRQMREQLGLGPLSLACQEQGLLHLYQAFCREGRCGECPLS